MGIACKHIFDSGRRWYLEKHYGTTSLVQYCDRTSSLENKLLLAVPAAVVAP